MDGVNNIFFVIMIILIVILCALKFIRVSRDGTEGFTQQSAFVVKNNDAIYDSFYSTIYDTLNDSGERAKFEYNKIIELTRPSPSRSVVLDVGSGTGHLVNKLSKNGYSAHGIDKSTAMVEQSSVKFPDIDVKCGDVMDSMMYDRGTFTHITCMNQTIYHIEDKQTFFRNCYNWLQPNGFLIVHLRKKGVDGEKEKEKEKIIDFQGFKYERKCNTDTGGNLSIIENFTDDVSKNVRQNELTLYMEPIDQIIKLATHNGFIAHAQVNFRNVDDEFIYVFERLL
jgi:2-polyprenyl-3-methyl-5-hydroxy-6-metoxy-1,4-benzoquinol methylase